jgi:hypothetical protein
MVLAFVGILAAETTTRRFPMFWRRQKQNACFGGDEMRKEPLTMSATTPMSATAKHSDNETVKNSSAAQVEPTEGAAAGSVDTTTASAGAAIAISVNEAWRYCVIMPFEVSGTKANMLDL